MAASPEEFLRRLGQQDEESLLGLLIPVPAPSAADPAPERRLDPKTSGLVRLAALLAVEASTTALRWGVELASGAGASDGDFIAVLLAAASAEGATQLVDGAGPVAAALGYREVSPRLPPQPPSRPDWRARVTASERDAAPSLR